MTTAATRTSHFRSTPTAITCDPTSAFHTPNGLHGRFVAFVLITLAAYWLLPRRGQNVLLLVASYLFY